MNEITINLSETDRKRLDTIALLLADLVDGTHTAPAIVKPTHAEAPKTAQDAPKAEPKESPAPAPAEAPAPDQTAEEHAKEVERKRKVLQALVQCTCAPTFGLNVQVRDLVKAYAQRVSLVPEDKIDELAGKIYSIVPADRVADVQAHAEEAGKA